MMTLPANLMAGMDLLGTGISAFGAFQTGNQAKGAYDYNASLADQNAEQIKHSNELTEYQKKKNLEAHVGMQAAQYAGSGIDVNTGSPIDVMTDTLSKGYLDIAIDKYNAELAQRGYQSDAEMKRAEGSAVKRESTLKAGLGLLKGAASYAEKQSNPSGKVE